MPKKKSYFPKRLSGDSLAFNQANDLLTELGVAYRRCSKDHLKIGTINYYPNAGTIMIDGISQRYAKRGEEALQELVEAQRARLETLRKTRPSTGNALLDSAVFAARARGVAVSDALLNQSASSPKLDAQETIVRMPEIDLSALVGNWDTPDAAPEEIDLSQFKTES